MFAETSFVTPSFGAFTLQAEPLTPRTDVFVPGWWIFARGGEHDGEMAAQSLVRRDEDGFASEEVAVRYPGYRALFVAWTLFGVLSYLRFQVLASVHTNLLFGLLEWLSCYYPWFLLTPIVFRLERRFPIVRGSRMKHLGILAVAGLALCYTASFAAGAIGAALHSTLEQGASAGVAAWAKPSKELLLQFALFVITVGASAFLRHLARVRWTERKAAELALEKSDLEKALRQAELETLRMRLNPHFLFNCLQNISALTSQDAKAASQMLTRLGDLLRVSLGGNYMAEISLREEVALTRAYLAIEQVRFGDRLTVLFDIAPETEQAMVPSLLLQPLVENAIKHGLRGRDGDGAICVRSRMERGKLVLTIEDNGTGFRVADTAQLELGIGLGATRDRLVRMYDGEQALALRSLPEGGAEVRITLPCAPCVVQPALADASTLASGTTSHARRVTTGMAVHGG